MAFYIIVQLLIYYHPSSPVGGGIAALGHCSGAQTGSLQKKRKKDASQVSHVSRHFALFLQIKRLFCRKKNILFFSLTEISLSLFFGSVAAG